MSEVTRDLTSHAVTKASRAISDIIRLTDTPQQALAITTMTMAALLYRFGPIVEAAIPDAKNLSNEDRFLALIAVMASILARSGPPSDHHARAIEVYTKKISRITTQEIGTDYVEAVSRRSHESPDPGR